MLFTILDVSQKSSKFDKGTVLQSKDLFFPILNFHGHVYVLFVLSG